MPTGFRSGPHAEYLKNKVPTLNSPGMPGRTYAVTTYRASNTYVHATTGYVFKKQLHSYVVNLQIYVRLQVVRHGVTRQCMHC